MAGMAKAAMDSGAEPKEVAKAAVQDAVAGATTEAEKESLALEFYNAATGRFPQDSSDRRAVYVGGFILAGAVFGVLVVFAAVVLLFTEKTVPDGVTTLATALVSGVIGGLFGYAKQG